MRPVVFLLPRGIGTCDSGRARKRRAWHCFWLRRRMTDTFSKSQRSQIMRSVHSTGTSAEKQCEAVLRLLKIRFKRHPANLPGSPDFVIKTSKLALFIHGCFWHGHQGCKNSTLPSSNIDYWSRKIDRNRKRDRRVRDALRKAGWRTAVIWECKLRDAGSVTRRLLKLTASNRSGEKLR